MILTRYRGEYLHKIYPELYKKRISSEKCSKCGLSGHRADKCPNGFMDEQGDAIM